MDSLNSLNPPNHTLPQGNTKDMGLDPRHPSLHCDFAVTSELIQTPAAATFLKLEDYAVLEQAQNLYLLQDPKTALFHIWVNDDALPIFKSVSWSAAYRTWLEVRQNQGHSEVRNAPQDPSASELHAWVNHHQDNPLFGQLIYRRDRRCEDLLQYAVQLSDTVALRWTAVNTVGELVLEPIRRRQHRLAKWVEPQPPSLIAAALHSAIELFHQRWDYSPYRFNSEHWARLIVTGHCGSFQRDEILAFWQQYPAQDQQAEDYPLPDILEFNLEAESLLTAAIATHQAFAKDTPQHVIP